MFILKRHHLLMKGKIILYKKYHTIDSPMGQSLNCCSAKHKLLFCKTPIVAMLFPCQHNPALILIESYAIPEHLFYILLIKSIPIPPIFYLP